MDRIQHGGEDMAHQRRKLKKIAEKKSGQERRRKGGKELEEKGTEGKGGEGKGRERKGRERKGKERKGREAVLSVGVFSAHSMMLNLLNNSLPHLSFIIIISYFLFSRHF